MGLNGYRGSLAADHAGAKREAIMLTRFCRMWQRNAHILHCLCLYRLADRRNRTRRGEWPKEMRYFGLGAGRRGWATSTTTPMV